MQRQRLASGVVQLIVDGALATALAIAVVIVIAMDRREKPAEEPAALEPVTVEPQPQAPAVRPLAIAVTPERPVYDDVGRLLDSLGSGYAYRPIPLDDLLEAERIEQFDVIFLTCSGYTDTWLGERAEGTLRGNEVYGSNPETLERAKQSLRKFVHDGGTLYASDLHGTTIAACFPEFFERSLDGRGAPQKVDAEVKDESLQKLLGERIELTFDMPSWRPAAFSGEGLAVLLDGEFKTIDGEIKRAPLLVRFPHGQGSVIFTSFHNEKQTSDKEKELLKVLVFSTVTAAVDAEAERTLARGGFSRTKKDLFSTSRAAVPIQQVYENTAVGDLQFVLAFAEQGAELELEVEGPDGVVRRERGQKTVTIEVPAAAAGSWRYEIRPLTVPSDNFPFTISVGRKR
jgi:hypothetical protein